MKGHLQITIFQVQLGENGTSFYLASEVAHVGHRVLVRRRYQIEAAKVATRPPGTVFLLDKMER